MRWHLGGSTDAIDVVKTYSFVHGTVSRRLPAGIRADDKSLTGRNRREMGVGKRRVTPHLGRREPQMPSVQRFRGSCWGLRGLLL